MKKLCVFFLCAFFLVLVSCSEDTNKGITNSQQIQLDSRETSNVEPYLISIFSAAEKDIPINTENGYTVGVLDENRSENECYVTYENESEYTKYRFVKNNELWSKAECIETENNISLGKSTVYTNAIAKIYDEFGVIMDTWYCVGKTATGNYTTYEYYYNPLPWSMDFFAGEQENDNKTWVVSFRDSWGSRYSSPNNPDKYYGNSWFWTDASGNFYGAQRVDLSYRLVVTDVITPPSAPNLSSPSSGATTDRIVNFSWNAVTGENVSKYKINVYNNGSVVKTAQPTGTTHTFSGFSYSTSYSWKVSAYNGMWGDFSTARSFTVKNPPPLAISVNSIGNNQYSASASGGTGNYTKYQWYTRNNGDPLLRLPAVGRWMEATMWEDQTTVSFNPSYPNFSLKCKVTDSSGNTKEDVISVGL